MQSSGERQPGSMRAVVRLLASERVLCMLPEKARRLENEPKAGCRDPLEVCATSRHGLQPDSHCLVSGGCVGGGYDQTRRYGTTRDRWQGNNRKVIRHMGKNIAEHKRTKLNENQKGTDKGVMGVHRDVVKHHGHRNDKLKD